MHKSTIRAICYGSTYPKWRKTLLKRLHCLLLNPFSRSYFLAKNCLIVCLKFGTLDLCKLIFRSQICTQTIHFPQGTVMGFVELYCLVCFLLCHGLLRKRKVKEIRKTHWSKENEKVLISKSYLHCYLHIRYIDSW